MALVFLTITMEVVSAEQIPKPCACTMDYVPVCCNGQTYSNGCSAFCDDGYTECAPGACEWAESPIFIDSQSPSLNSQPVCGGFDHCSSYNDGCNECFCDESGMESCTEMFCTETTDPFCTSCQTGYTLNKDTNQCTPCVLPQCQDPCGPFNTMSALGEIVCAGYPDAYCQGTVDCDGCYATYFDGTGAEIDCVMTSYSEPTEPLIPGCGGIAYCQNYQKDTCNACGCSNPSGGLQHFGICTMMACPELEINQCTECMSGYSVDGNGGCTKNLIEQAHEVDLPGCGGIAYCQSYRKDECNSCGCSNPSVGMNEYGRCTLRECPVLERNECTECMDGYELDGNGGCKPFCGGLEHCSSYNDGCNDCICDHDQHLEGCTMKLCLDTGGLLGERDVHCTSCEAGYLLNEQSGKCEVCACIAIADPVCCDGISYGNPCMAGCAGVTTECQPGLCTEKKVSCRSPSQCDRNNGFKCRVNPQCRISGGTSLECQSDKLCMALGGECQSDSDCQVDFKCLDRNPNRKLCIKFQ